MQLPFRGEWYVFWGATTKVNHHASTRGQRAPLISLSKALARPLSQRYRSPQRRLLFYGKEILAAATGTVVTAIDGVPTTCQAP